MPDADARRWNERYRQDFFSRHQPARQVLVKHRALLPNSGLCLDIATGSGSNAAYISKAGLQVVGIDIAIAGLRLAKARNPLMDCVLADLTQFSFPGRPFSAILNFYYLQRDLFPSFKTWLRPGGLLFFETLTRGMLNIRPDIQEDYLLNPGELKESFKDWEILDYFEGWSTSQHGHQKAIATLVARNPS